MRRPSMMRQLMKGDGCPTLRRLKRGVWRQLNVISRRAVEGAIAANSYDSLAIAEDNIDGFGPPPWGFFHGWSDECGDTVDLRGMKDGERPQERNASRMVFFPLGRVVIAYRQLFEE